MVYSIKKYIILLDLCVLCFNIGCCDILFKIFDCKFILNFFDISDIYIVVINEEKRM